MQVECQCGENSSIPKYLFLNSLAQTNVSSFEAGTIVGGPNPPQLLTFGQLHPPQESGLPFQLNRPQGLNTSRGLIPFLDYTHAFSVMSN